MKKLSFILLTLVVSLNSLALTQEEFFRLLEKDDIYNGYLFSFGEVSPYSIAGGGFGYVLYKDGTGKFCMGNSGSEFIEHKGIRARYYWREKFDILWKYNDNAGNADVAIMVISFLSYEISNVRIEMLTTHTDEQFQIIQNIVQQKINNLHQKYSQWVEVPAQPYMVIKQPQRDQLNKYYFVLTPYQTLPFNNYDFHCPVSKDYQEVLDSKQHKAGTTYTL